MEIEDTAGNKVSGSVEIDKIGSAIDTKNTIAKAEGGHIDFTTKDNDFGGTEYSLSVVTDGKVEAGNTGIVTGDTVYNETRVSKDGEYIKQSNSAAENLTVLDSQVKTNTDAITNISGNVTNLNSRVSKLDTRINRVGAGAAALAALHPQDYDPTAKWDFAAGYGNYKSLMPLLSVPSIGRRTMFCSLLEPAWAAGKTCSTPASASSLAAAMSIQITPRLLWQKSYRNRLRPSAL